LVVYNPSLDRPHLGDLILLPAATKRPDWRRLRRIALWTVATLFVVFMALAATAAFLVSRSVNIPFLQNRVVALIEESLGPGYDVSVAKAALASDPVLGLVARLETVSVHDATGAEVLRIPTTLLALDLGALVTSRDLIRAVEVDGLWASIRQVEGEFALGASVQPLEIAAAPTAALDGPVAVVEPAAAAIVAGVGPGVGGATPATTNRFAALSDPIAALDRSLAQFLSFAGRSGFERVSLYDAGIELWRPGATEPQRFERTDVVLTADPALGRLSASVSASGYSGRWSIDADWSRSGGSRAMALTFSQVTMADILGNGGPTTNIPIYGRANIRIGSDGVITAATANIDLGAGSFAFGPKATPILLDEGRIRLTWDVAGETIIIEPSLFTFGPSYAVLAGSIQPDGTDRFTFNLDTIDALLAPRDSPAAPLAARIRFAGNLDLGQRLLTFNRASVETPAGSLLIAANLGLDPGGPSLALAATFTEMPVSTLMQIWPAGLADGGRKWLLNSMTAGRVISGHVEAEIPAAALRGEIPTTPQMLRAELNLDGATFHTFQGMPDIENARGMLVFAGTTFGADIESGEMIAPGGARIEIGAAAFAIANTATTVPMARLEIDALGPIGGFGALADQEPIGALSRFGMPPEALTGQATARVSATWPLVEGMTIEEADYRIVVDIDGFATAQPLEGRTVRDGDIELIVTPEIVTVTGDALVDGVPADLDLAFPLVADVEGQTRLRMVLDEDDRRRLGFNLEGFLGGTVTAAVIDLAPQEVGQHYELDLGPARVTLAPLGWSKAAGVPATMSFDIIETAEGYHVRDVRLSGGGVTLVGEAFLDRDYVIQRVVATEFSLREGDDMAFTLTRSGNGFAVDIAGHAIDIRSILANGVTGVAEAAESGTAANRDMEGDFALHGRFAEIEGFNGAIVRNAVVDFEVVGGTITRLALEGQLGGQPISVAYAEPAGIAALDVYVGDAGSFLRFINLYDNVEGGILRANGQEYADGLLRGAVSAEGFRIVDEPALARFVEPIGTTADGLSPVIAFDGLNFNFTISGSRILIDDALLLGGQMGAILNGWVDVGAGELGITGTYIPDYQYNNFFGRIPLFGLALGGGPREGLFGMTFRVVGPFETARLEINPLSLLAPGILRKFFEFLPPRN
jgi:hypothetical protein